MNELAWGIIDKAQSESEKLSEPNIEGNNVDGEINYVTACTKM